MPKKEQKTVTQISLQEHVEDLKKTYDKANAYFSAGKHEKAKKRYLSLNPRYEQILAEKLLLTTADQQALLGEWGLTQFALGEIIHAKDGFNSALPYYTKAVENFEKAAELTGPKPHFAPLASTHAKIRQGYGELSSKAESTIQKTEYRQKALDHYLKAIGAYNRIPEADYSISDYIRKAIYHADVSNLSKERDTGDAIVHLESAITVLQAMEDANPGALATEIIINGDEMSCHLLCFTYLLNLAELQIEGGEAQTKHRKEAVGHFKKAIQQGERPAKKYYDLVRGLKEYHTTTTPEEFDTQPVKLSLPTTELSLLKAEEFAIPSTNNKLPPHRAAIAEPSPPSALLNNWGVGVAILALFVTVMCFFKKKRLQKRLSRASVNNSSDRDEKRSAKVTDSKRTSAVSPEAVSEGTSGTLSSAPPDVSAEPIVSSLSLTASSSSEESKKPWKKAAAEHKSGAIGASMAPNSSFFSAPDSSPDVNAAPIVSSLSPTASSSAGENKKPRKKAKQRKKTAAKHKSEAIGASMAPNSSFFSAPDSSSSAEGSRHAPPGGPPISYT